MSPEIYPGSLWPRRNFWADIGKIFSYAFTKEGAATLVVGGLFFGAAGFVAGRIACIGFVVTAIITAYLLMYEFKIINHTAHGHEDIPLWPDPQGIFESLFLVLGVYAVCFGPSIACLVFVFVAPPLAVPLVLFSILLFLAGCLYYPMAYLMNALFQSPFAAFNVGFGFRSIAVITGEYAVVVLLSFGFLAVPIVATLVLSIAGVMGAEAQVIAKLFGIFVTTFIGLYLRLANGYMLGRLYYCTEERLNWFPGTEKKIMAPPPHVFAAPGQRPSAGLRQAPAPQRMVPAAPVPGLDEPPEPMPRQKAADRGTAKWAPQEDPFLKFREEKISETRKKEPEWPALFDKAKKNPEPETGPAGQENQANFAGRRTSFSQGPQEIQAAPAGQTAARRPTGAHQSQGSRPAGPAQAAQDPRRRQSEALRRQPDAPITPSGRPGGTETRVRHTESFKKPADESHPAPGPQAADDHMGPVKFSPEVQALVDEGNFEEAKKIVSRMREGAKNRGSLAEISNYRKQLDIIDMMEKA